MEMIAHIALTMLDAMMSPPPIEREFRGVWVATVDNIDWPSKPGLSVESQKAELQRIVDVCADMKMNAIVFQVRPHADAMYPSKIEPWSYYLTGVQGQEPSPAWDPLQFIIERAHERGIELHAWFNPYRANHPAQKGPVSDSHVSRTNPGAVYGYGNFGWMDPAQGWVQDRSFNVFMDVVERYDVDGIHIDDYFYPYPVRENGNTVPFPDQAVYDAYRKSGGRLGKSDWRRKAVDDFVHRVYNGIKDRKPWVKFGISPFGIYRPGVPKGTTAGIDQFEALSADALKWFQKGWCDYLSPQLYWSIESKGQSFPLLLDWWAEVNTKKRHLWPGIYTGRVGPSDRSFTSQQIVRQLGLIRKKGEEASGHVHFSMKTFTLGWGGLTEILGEKFYVRPALPPESRWLGSKAPARPKAAVLEIAGTTIKIGLTVDKAARFLTVQRKNAAGDWQTLEITSPKDVLEIDATGAEQIAFTAVSKTGIASKAALVKLSNTPQ